MSTVAEHRVTRGVWTRARAADGTQIAWRADGPASDPGLGRTAVVFCNGIACSDDYWGGMVGQLAGHRTVIRWDYRGHHRSGASTDSTAVGPGVLAGDLATVIEAADVPRVVLIGHSYGVQIALHASALLGERLRGLVAVCGAAGRALHGLPGPIPATVALPALRATAALAPGLAARAWQTVWDSPAPYWIARAIGGTSSSVPRYVLDDFQRHVAGLDPERLGAMMHAMATDDASDVLPGLQIPVLAAAGRRDRITPLHRVRAIAESAPRGALVIHPRATHTLPVEHPAWLTTQLQPLLAAADRDETDTR